MAEHGASGCRHRTKNKARAGIPPLPTKDDTKNDAKALLSKTIREDRKPSDLKGVNELKKRDFGNRLYKMKDKTGSKENDVDRLAKGIDFSETAPVAWFCAREVFGKVWKHFL